MRHALVLSCTCLTEDFPSMLGLMADMVRNPSLPEREIETRRGEIVTSIRQDQDNPAMVAVEEELALLYPDGHPYGRRVKGTLESVERIDRRALELAHRERFTPAGLQVVCVGDVEPEQVVGEAERVFGDWRGPAVGAVGRAAAGRRFSGAASSSFPMADKAQTDIAYGFNTVSRSDPAYYALSVMNNILGQYALGGRLGDNIRERQGMAYYVFSAFEPNLGEGPLVIRAGVNPANVDRDDRGDRRGSAPDGGRRRDGRGTGGVEEVPRRVDAAAARDERRRSRRSCSRASSSASGWTTT